MAGINLTDSQRQELQHLARRGRDARVVRRAQGLSQVVGLIILIGSQLYPKALLFEQKESPQLLEGFLIILAPLFSSDIPSIIPITWPEISKLGSLSIPAAVAFAGHPQTARQRAGTSLARIPHLV
jgi:hypothetical protein